MASSPRVRLAAFSLPPDLKDVEKELESLKAEKEAAIAQQDFERAAQLRDAEHKLRESLEERQRQWKQKGSDRVVVGEEDIASRSVREDALRDHLLLPVRRFPGLIRE